MAPLEPPYDPDVAAALERLGPPIQLFRILARRPERAHGISGWGGYYLSKRSALTLRQRELVIMRTTSRCGADYEWGVHVAFFAKKVGLDEAQLTALAARVLDATPWSDGDLAILRAVDELHDSNDLSDKAWQALAAAVGDEGALEVTLLTGWYHAISYTVRALRLPLEPGTDPVDRWSS